MARKKAQARTAGQPGNGNGRWDEAFQHLIESQAALQHAQATMVQTQAQFSAEMAEVRRTMAQIVDILHEHSRLHRQHTADIARLREELPDAVREKMGFVPPTAARPRKRRARR